jgi:hypothetical protein
MHERGADAKGVAPAEPIDAEEDHPPGAIEDDDVVGGRVDVGDRKHSARSADDGRERPAVSRDHDGPKRAEARAEADHDRHDVKRDERRERNAATLTQEEEEEGDRPDAHRDRAARDRTDGGHSTEVDEASSSVALHGAQSRDFGINAT